jgi:hypothetical protein
MKSVIYQLRAFDLLALHELCNGSMYKWIQFGGNIVASSDGNAVLFMQVPPEAGEPFPFHISQDMIQDMVEEQTNAATVQVTAWQDAGMPQEVRIEIKQYTQVLFKERAPWYSPLPMVDRVRRVMQEQNPGVAHFDTDYYKKMARIARLLRGCIKPPSAVDSSNVQKDFTIYQNGSEEAAYVEFAHTLFPTCMTVMPLRPTEEMHKKVPDWVFQGTPICAAQRNGKRH